MATWRCSGVISEGISKTDCSKPQNLRGLGKWLIFFYLPTELVAFGLKDDFVGDEVRGKVNDVKDPIGGEVGWDHFVALGFEGEVVPEGRVHAAEVEEGEADAVALEFGSHSAEEACDREFACDVSAGVFHDGFAEDAGEGEEEAVFVGSHGAGSSLSEEEGGASVDVEDAGEFGVGGFEGGLDEADAGTMDNAVDFSEGGDSVFNEFSGGAGGGEVGGFGGDRVGESGAELRFGFGVEVELVAAGKEFAGGGKADTAASASEEDGLHIFERGNEEDEKRVAGNLELGRRMKDLPKPKQEDGADGKQAKGKGMAMEDAAKEGVELWEKEKEEGHKPSKQGKDWKKDAGGVEVKCGLPIAAEEASGGSTDSAGRAGEGSYAFKPTFWNGYLETNPKGDADCRDGEEPKPEPC